LEASQLGKFMQDMAHHDGHGQMSEQELSSAIAFIMKAADADKSGSIDEEELKHAISAWKNWSHSATRLSEKVKELLLKYDTDMSGSLDRTQLLAMLTHLNEDTPVTEAEADRIIGTADKRGNGKIDMEEIYPALALWYQIDDDDDSTQQTDGLGKCHTPNVFLRLV
jgi:Ca2+-binding EF-hand superfamily protein